MIKDDLEAVNEGEITEDDLILTFFSGLLSTFENFVQCILITIKLDTK